MPPSDYRVDVIPLAEQQLRDLAARAKQQNQAGAVAVALKEIMVQLTSP